LGILDVHYINNVFVGGLGGGHYNMTLLVRGVTAGGGRAAGAGKESDCLHCVIQPAFQWSSCLSALFPLAPAYVCATSSCTALSLSPCHRTSPARNGGEHYIINVFALAFLAAKYIKKAYIIKAHSWR
jgi:hypothetical protein